MGVLMQMSLGNTSGLKASQGSQPITFQWNGRFLQYLEHDHMFNTQELIAHADQEDMEELLHGWSADNRQEFYEWYSCFMAEAVLSCISKEELIYPEALQSDMFLQGLMNQAHEKAGWSDLISSPSIESVRELISSVVPVGSTPTQLLYSWGKDDCKPTLGIRLMPYGAETECQHPCAIVEFHGSGVLVRHVGGQQFISLPVPVDADHGYDVRYATAAIPCLRLLLRYCGLVPTKQYVHGPQFENEGYTWDLFGLRKITTLEDLSRLLCFCTVDKSLP